MITPSGQTTRKTTRLIERSDAKTVVTSKPNGKPTDNVRKTSGGGESKKRKQVGERPKTRGI
jgi:hypothetical protein